MALLNEFTKTFQMENHSQVLIRKIYKEEFRIVCLTKYQGAYFSMDMEFDTEEAADQCYDKYGNDEAKLFFKMVTGLQDKQLVND